MSCHDARDTSSECIIAFTTVSIRFELGAIRCDGRGFLVNMLHQSLRSGGQSVLPSPLTTEPVVQPIQCKLLAPARRVSCHHAAFINRPLLSSVHTYTRSQGMRLAGKTAPCMAKCPAGGRPHMSALKTYGLPRAARQKRGIAVGRWVVTAPDFLFQTKLGRRSVIGTGWVMKR